MTRRVGCAENVKSGSTKNVQAYWGSKIKNYCQDVIYVFYLLLSLKYLKTFYAL